ncbi:hypothetical protein JOD82_002231 [Paenibacillus sp. 1182]|uniref:hypothetical protein n=1 Tax=Paenibacillus sp. 1182 TaxID=2806565 RepID=UPI001AE4A7C8|nr:hypothetical protein [Paenibacillus sp. 1182]MBP1309211.1 hypothetical protein [Paenibacillus sp. 1182]
MATEKYQLSDAEETLTIGKCDFCYEEGRYLKPLHDKYGDHVLDQCFYGCEDKRSVPNEPKENFEIISIVETYRSYCHDSKWKISIKLNDKVLTMNLTRLHSENEASLREKIVHCRNRHEIKRLNLYVFHN